MPDGSANGHAHPAILDARECLELEQQYQQLTHDDETMRLRKAVLLARDLDTCRALLRGEPVPLERLDQTQLARFKRR